MASSFTMPLKSALMQMNVLILKLMEIVYVVVLNVKIHLVPSLASVLPDILTTITCKYVSNLHPDVEKRNVLLDAMLWDQLDLNANAQKVIR